MRMLGRRRRGLSGKIMVLLIILAAVAGPATVYIYLNLVPHVTNSITMSGTLIVNSDGQAKGTPGLSSVYNANLSVGHGSGSMNLTLRASNRDVLQKRDYSITNLVANDTVVSMQVDGKSVVMVFVPNDTNDTGQFNGFFVASWGPGTNNNKGTINPLFFDGAGSQYFVELRLIPVAPPLPTFMSIRTYQPGEDRLVVARERILRSGVICPFLNFLRIDRLIDI